MPAEKKQNYDAQVFKAADYIRKYLGSVRAGTGEPPLAILLGSGLGDFANTIQARRSLPFSSIPHFPTASIAGHSGMLVFGGP